MCVSHPGYCFRDVGSRAVVCNELLQVSEGVSCQTREEMDEEGPNNIA